MKSFSGAAAKLADDLLVYAITDRAWLRVPAEASEEEKCADLAAQVKEAAAGGATIIQMREKHLSGEPLLAEALVLRDACHEAGVPFIVNDDVNVAIACNADGIHVGQDDMNAKDVRALVGPHMILGVSAQTVEQALRAQEQGADYLGVGAVFPTGSKDDAAEVSHETLAAICEAVDIPVVAIGGVTCNNVAQIGPCGICGASVISAIFGKADIAAAARELREATVAALRV